MPRFFLYFFLIFQLSAGQVFGFATPQKAHAVAGGLASELSGGSFADGALAAGLAEAAGPLVGNTNLSPQQQINLQRLIATAAVLIRNDGDADGASFAVGVAASADQYNRQLHQNEKNILAGLLGEDEVDEDIFDGDLSALSEEDQAILAVACAQIHCADHLNGNDPTYAQRAALQQRGFDLRRANDTAFQTLRTATVDYFEENNLSLWTNPYTIASLHEANAHVSGQAQGGFLYTGFDARHDIMLATGVDLYGQARAQSGPAAIPEGIVNGAIAAFETFATAVDCTTNREACQVLWDTAVQAVDGVVQAVRSIPDYPDLLRNTDIAVARYIDGNLSREEFVTVLADAGRIQGTAQSVIVGLGLGGGSVSNLLRDRTPGDGGGGSAVDQTLPDNPNPGTRPGATDAEAGNPNGFITGPKSDGSFADGGHLVDRHVGKTEQELIDRANGVGQRAPKGGASSYSNLDSADYYTNQVVTSNKADIDAYLASGDTKPRAFSIQDTGQSTGRWVPKGGSQSQPVTGATVVIKPNPNVPRGYDVVTGHPCQTGSCPVQ